MHIFFFIPCLKIFNLKFIYELFLHGYKEIAMVKKACFKRVHCFDLEHECVTSAFLTKKVVNIFLEFFNLDICLFFLSVRILCNVVP